MYAGRHRQETLGAPPRRRFARVVVVVGVATGMTVVGLLAGGRDDPRVSEPPRRPAVVSPTPAPVVSAAQLRTELRQTGQRRAKIQTALARIAALTGQLRLSGLEPDQNIQALRTRLRHRDSALAATERRLTEQLAAAAQ